MTAVGTTALAASKDLGKGFRDHGVASPISNHRGTVATVDGQGHNVLLQWLMDHRGGYCLLLLDANTGTVEQHMMPFEITSFDAPFASILSSAGKFYTHMYDRLIEFDPVSKKFTAVHKTVPQMAMAMTEDDQGRIWSVTYPQSGLACFDPKTGEFVDYGHVRKETWQQYDRFLAADDAGFIYFAVGNTASQIVIFDPKTRKATDVLSPSERKQGTAYLYRDMDGKVYAQALQGDKEPWYELYKGKARKLDAPPKQNPKKFVSGNQALNETTFPDGTKATSDLVNRVLTVEDPKTGEKKEHKFDYTSEGAIVMGVSASPDGTAVGGTAFPMRFFRYDPKTDTLENRAAYGQWNTAQKQGDKLFVFGYPNGFLLEYDPAKPWVPTEKGKEGCNPQFLLQTSPTLYRPTEILPLPDGRRLVFGGTPAYGYTGGGMLIWDRKDNSHTLLKDTDLIPDQSIESMAALPDDRILVGTTTAPGTGGEKRANLAELYVFNLKDKKIEWREPLLKGVQEYTDMAPGPNGLVYGVADSTKFFVFDPVKRQIVHQFDTNPKFGRTVHEQGPRVFVKGDGDTTYMLFHRSIAKIDPKTHALTKVVDSPVEMGGGGDYIDGRIYFLSGSHIGSYEVNAK